MCLTGNIQSVGEGLQKVKLQIAPLVIPYSLPFFSFLLLQTFCMVTC
jgi:hypothetical protein